jgi:sugar/nucleoside kinase (ribokinase family)
MEPIFVVAGRITREYILPPVGVPLLDVAGGSALYAAGGLLLWDTELGLLSRVGEDYPRARLREIESRGIDTAGIEIIQQSLDLRSFYSYDGKFEGTHGSPVSQFARRGLTFPKALLGYQSPGESASERAKPGAAATAGLQIPSSYLEARAIHLCPLDFAAQRRLISAFKAATVATLTVDPSPDCMVPRLMKELRVALAGVTAFLPSEEELRSLFWGQTYDLWEMAASIAESGCEVVVIKRGSGGQAVYDSRSKDKWEIPAYPARLADPTGVGDAFCGGFLAGYRRTYDPLQAALYGNVSASLKLEGSGALYPLGTLSGLAEARLNVLKDLVRKV